MITVIIPALNEEKTIGHVVKLARSSQNVTEVIVVDDKSFDRTIEEAKKENAIVITSTKLGKGASMNDGILYATNSIIVFLDADITTYPENIISLLTEPIISDRADFTKSCFFATGRKSYRIGCKTVAFHSISKFPIFLATFKWNDCRPQRNV